MLRTLAVIFVLSCCAHNKVQSKGLNEEFSWSIINYRWSDTDPLCPAQKTHSQVGDFIFPSGSGYGPRRNKNITVFSRNGGQGQSQEQYIGENNIPMGCTPDGSRNRIFVTVPRRRIGIPSTLNYIPLDCKERTNVPLIPYPNWELNSLETSRSADPTDPKNPFVSVYRTTIDACNRLWFVDMGILEYPTGREQLQQFTLVVMDLNTDKVIRRFAFSTDDANPQATLASVTVDVSKDNCDDAYAYIPDLVNYKLLVYSWKENDAWRITHNYFFPDPLQGDFNIGGQEFQWNDGIFSIVLSNAASNGHKTAFFHSMAASKEFSVNTKILRDRTLATRSYHGTDFKIVGDRGKNGQCSTHELHTPTGVFFMGEVSKNGLYCWNIKKDVLTPNTQDVIQENANTMIYPSDVKIDSTTDKVYMMTNSMPVFLYDKLNYNQISFRIWANHILAAIKGTKCE